MPQIDLTENMTAYTFTHDSLHTRILRMHNVEWILQRWMVFLYQSMSCVAVLGLARHLSNFLRSALIMQQKNIIIDTIVIAVVTITTTMTIIITDIIVSSSSSIIIINYN